MVEIDEFKIHPVFFPAISVIELKEEEISDLKKIETYDYGLRNEGGSSASLNFKILDDFPDQKNIVMMYFDRFKNNVLGYNETSFAMSRSWGTKTVKGEQSHFHEHRNSMYSAVLYLEDIDVDSGGDLQFTNDNMIKSTFSPKPPEIRNPMNSPSFFVKPRKNRLVLFDSFLHHRIGRYIGKEPRYSIAMNFIPVGEVGEHDSYVNISIVS